jgi:hypothetical protein
VEAAESIDNMNLEEIHKIDKGTEKMEKRSDAKSPFRANSW